MMTLSYRPFGPCDGRQAGLWYLPARWRYTTHDGPPRRGRLHIHTLRSQYANNAMSSPPRQGKSPFIPASYLNCPIKPDFRMSGDAGAGSPAGVAVSCHDGGGPSRLGSRLPCTEDFPPAPACAALWTSDRRRMIPGRLRRRSYLRSPPFGLADPVGPHRRVME